MPKILLVEDDQFLTRMYLKKLEVSGFEVDSASNGEVGLEKMASFAPDLVLMDVMMPKLNGIDALEKAKKDPAIAKIPIVMLTNLSSATDAQSAIGKGATDFIIKSDVTPTQVVERVKKILKIS